MFQIGVQIVLGVLTVTASFLAARRGAREADRRGSREQWWRRFEWAVESIYHGDPARMAAGDSMLRQLFSSPLAGEEERTTLLDVMWAITVEPRPSADRSRQSGRRALVDRAHWLVDNDPEIAASSLALQRVIEDAEDEPTRHAAEVLLWEDASISMAFVMPVVGHRDRFIVYLLLNAKHALDDRLRTKVATLLPKTGIRMAVMDEPPLSPNGKIDRSKLSENRFPPEPEFWTDEHGHRADGP